MLTFYLCTQARFQPRDWLLIAMIILAVMIYIKNKQTKPSLIALKEAKLSLCLFLFPEVVQYLFSLDVCINKSKQGIRHMIKSIISFFPQRNF